MLLKKVASNTGQTLRLALLLTLVISFLALQNLNFEVFLEDVKQSILAADTGMSNYRRNSELLRSAPAMLVGAVKGHPQRPALETLYIDINPEEYRQLLQDRENALAHNLLIEPMEVNARVRYQGRSFRADARLKGDLRDHWLSKNRMSLRIDLKGDNAVMGYSKFSVHKPAARQHPFDQTFQSLIKRTGTLSSEQAYARVIFNGENWGVMNLEEAMSMEFLEKRQRRESLIVRFANEDRAVMEETLKLQGLPQYPDYRLSDERLYVKMYEAGKYQDDPTYRRWYTYIAEQRLSPDEVNLYDVDSYSRALYMALFWNDGHSLWYANSRHYFNPYTLRLEPITTDAAIPYKLRETNIFFMRDIFNPVSNNSVYNALVRSDEFIRRSEANYRVAREAAMHFDEDFQYWQSYFPLDNIVPMFREAVPDNLRMLEDPVLRNQPLQPVPLQINPEPVLPSAEQLALLTDHVHLRHYDDGRIQLFNLLPDAVQLHRLLLDGRPALELNLTLPGYQPGRYEALQLQTDLTGALDARLAIATEYAGQLSITGNEISLSGEGLRNPLQGGSTPTEYLQRDDAGNWRFLTGTWQVTEPLLLRGRVEIPAGTTLLFGSDASLIIQGDLVVQGEPERPVLLDASGEHWKGLYVFEGEGESRLQHVTVRRAGALEDGLLRLTGAVTFYRSRVSMQDVLLTDSLAEDALNLVHTRFDIDGLSVRNAVSDGVDSDFSQGAVASARFAAVNGDAIDFSGSQVHIARLDAEDIYDKAVSVGEGSDITLDNGYFSRVGSGVVVKDGSSASVDSLAVDTYVIAAAMTYSKKHFYGIPSLQVRQASVRQASDAPPPQFEPYVRETGTQLSVAGAPVAEQAVDVDNLYQNTVMRK